MMRHRATRALSGLPTVVLLALLGFPLSPNGAAGQSADEQSVREHFDRLCAAIGSSDLEVSLAMFEENAVSIPPGEAVVVGVEAFRERAEQFVSEIDYVLDEYQVRRIDVSGDLAYILATYSEHWTPKAGGETTYSSGRWATMWKRQDDGGWKIAAEIWNLDPEED